MWQSANPPPNTHKLIKGWGDNFKVLKIRGWEMTKFLTPITILKDIIFSLGIGIFLKFYRNDIYLIHLLLQYAIGLYFFFPTVYNIPRVI